MCCFALTFQFLRSQWRERRLVRLLLHAHCSVLLCFCVFFLLFGTSSSPSLPVFFFCKDRTRPPRRRLLRLRLGPLPLLVFFYSGSFLYDFNGQDLLSVSESDSSHPLLFFFFFVVVRSQYFSLRGHVKCLFFQPQRTTGSIFEEEILSLDWAFSVPCIFPAIFIFQDKDIFEVKGQQN